jgi:hypothetical protein
VYKINYLWKSTGTYIELAYPKPDSLKKEADELPMIIERNKVIRAERTEALVPGVILE